MSILIVSRENVQRGFPTVFTVRPCFGEHIVLFRPCPA